MTGSHVFVCSHSSRDKRCGFCGPILIKKFKEEAELRGLDNVSVTDRELDKL
ncbi:putative thioredoxin-like ferredoxin, Thioredoxin-like superfamily [Helianthus annuus]|nr:putative thioredoxin-like ferredoxin, Thioredoxin-like superfamily [Helianthus annuus]